MWNISDTYVTVWEVEMHEKHALVRCSTSRKTSKKGVEPKTYANSNWIYVKFLFEAFEKIKKHGLKEKDRIKVLRGGVAQESYEVDGEKKWPKFAQISVFDWETIEDHGPNLDTPPTVEDDEEEEPTKDETPW
jgi:hypothetical protein